MRTCHQGDGKECLMDPEDIQANYISGWLLVDLISTIPFDVLFNAAILPQLIFKNSKHLNALQMNVSISSDPWAVGAGSIDTNLNEDNYNMMSDYTFLLSSVNRYHRAF